MDNQGGPESQTILVVGGVIATPCPPCQTNVEMYQDAIDEKYGTDFHIPVVFYSQLMAVAFGMDGKAEAGQD